MSNDPAGLRSKFVLRVVVDITLLSIRMLSVSRIFAFTWVVAERLRSCVETIVFPLMLTFNEDLPCSPSTDIKSLVWVTLLTNRSLEVESVLMLT
jgi:hypothetical protein